MRVDTAAHGFTQTLRNFKTKTVIIFKYVFIHSFHPLHAAHARDETPKRKQQTTRYLFSPPFPSLPTTNKQSIFEEFAACDYNQQFSKNNKIIINEMKFSDKHRLS